MVRSVKSLLLVMVMLCAVLAGTCQTVSGVTIGTLGEGEVIVKSKQQTGDFDSMAERRVIRFLIPFGRTFFYLDGANKRGLSYEAAMHFEKFINKRLKKKHLKVHVVVIPTERNKLFTELVEGYGDVAIGNLTITDKRKELVDFSDPFMKNVAEVVVTRKDVPDINNIMELSGRDIYVRKSSSYYESLLKLNETLSALGKKTVKLSLADENLEDEDLLEMLDAGAVSMLIVDKHKADFWTDILTNIKVHSAAVYSGGQIAWAIRKNSPQLKKIINDFAKENKKGTLHGNMLFKRYLKSTKYIKHPGDGANQKRLKGIVQFFKTYGEQYGFPYLLVTALAYQESRLDQKAKSQVGAVGVMQILPSTAQDKNVNIPNIHEVEANIHAGCKYLRFMADRYFSDPEIEKLNRVLFTFAAYNAGPAKVAKLRREAKEMRLDPNVWFQNVEVVAAKRIGRETVQYVSNIFKYYIIYSYMEKQGRI